MHVITAVALVMLLNVPSLLAQDISGVVTGPNGPEAGVWVIAETDDLPTKFVRIVVTDDHRFERGDGGQDGGDLLRRGVRRHRTEVSDH